MVLWFIELFIATFLVGTLLSIIGLALSALAMKIASYFSKD